MDKTYEQFVIENLDVPSDLMEPICPFCGCECEMAYNIEHCRNCEECKRAYFGEPSTFECIWGDGEPESVVATLDPPPEEEHNWWGYDATLTGEDEPDQEDLAAVDELTRWAIENDCCAVHAKMPFGGDMEIRIGKNSVTDGAEVGMLVTYGFKDTARAVIALALERADALLMWGDVTMGYNTYEGPIGVARTVDEALEILQENTGFTGWELL